MALGALMKEQQKKGGPFAKRAKLMKQGKYTSFGALVAGLKKKGHSDSSAKAVAAKVGRNIYGKKGMQKLASHGKTSAGKRFKREKGE